MIKNITLISFFLLLFCYTSIYAQIKDGTSGDSTEYKFGVNDVLNYTSKGISLDTIGTKLWRIGSTTLKPYFQEKGKAVRAIVTDTANVYPVNANDWFVLKIDQYIQNMIISFEHKFETRKGKDGGMVEYSVDSGKTWYNVKNTCNADSGSGMGWGIFTKNFYTLKDTLENGEPAFTGTDTNWQYSRLQYYYIAVVKTTGTIKCDPKFPLQLRFRFVSDGNVDTMAGWAIKRIVIEADRYSGIEKLANKSLKVSPNPSADGIFYFPVLQNEDKYRLQLTNITGKVLLDIAYTHQINLSKLASGLYFYKVRGEDELYTGRLLKE